MWRSGRSCRVTAPDFSRSRSMKRAQTAAVDAPACSSGTAANHPATRYVNAAWRFAVTGRGFNSKNHDEGTEPRFHKVNQGPTVVPLPGLIRVELEYAGFPFFPSTHRWTAAKRNRLRRCQNSKFHDAKRVIKETAAWSIVCATIGSVKTRGSGKCAVVAALRPFQAHVVGRFRPWAETGG